jgi:PPOX class probable F420-dependent enzyme
MLDSSGLLQFKGKKYICIDTYRRNGQAVRTPVWFVQEEGVIYIRAWTDSGKVKRMRSNPQVRVAPCSIGGEIMGNWVNGKAEPAEDMASHHLDTLFNKRYGAQKRLTDVVASVRGRKYLLYRIRLVNQTP